MKVIDFDNKYLIDLCHLKYFSIHKILKYEYNDLVDLVMPNSFDLTLLDFKYKNNITKLIIDEHENVFGFLSYSKDNNEIEDFYIKNQFIKTGLGTFLFNTLVRSLGSYEKLKDCVVYSPILSKDFFMKLGFKFDGLAKKDINDTYVLCAKLCF